MSLYSTVKSWFTPATPKSTYTHPRLIHLAGKRLRETVGDNREAFFNAPLSIVPPPDADQSWRLQSLDSITLSRLSPADLINLVIDLSPEVSRALFDFIRMLNPGWECKALRPRSDSEDRRGQRALDAFFDQLKTFYGSPDVPINRLILGGFTRGVFFSEIVLDGSAPVDLATPDPYSARFVKKQDPVRGQIFQLGQWQGGKFVELTAPTVSYIPIDSLPNSPYGRSLVSPALFTAIFLLGMLHDIRRVVQQQGWPRIDIAIDMEKLSIPPGMVLGSKEFELWINATINEIEEAFSTLEPDDTYIHTSVVQVNRPVSAVNADSLGAVDGLIKGLERMIARALKTMPLLLGLDSTGSETHANRQWEIHAAGIKALQHLLEAQLESHLSFALRAMGIQARVEFKFAELRASELLRDAQAESMMIANAKAKYDNGWISQDEASMEITGEPADQEEPRTGKAPAAIAGSGDAAGEPGASEEEIVQGDGENEEPQANEDRILDKVFTNGRHV
jgi:hypothetical protein